MLGLSSGSNTYKFFIKINSPVDKSKKIGKEANAHKRNIKIWDIFNIFDFHSIYSTYLNLRIIINYFLHF